MPFYFAYGANMDVAAMAERCPASRPVSLARLPRHGFFIMREGYASVRRSPHDEVHGVLWDLALADVRVLDAFEGIASGLYVKINQPVITAQGPRRALVYVGASAEPGRPKPGYLEAVLASAEAWELPPAYRRGLARLLQGSVRASPRDEPPPLPAGPEPRVRPRAFAPQSTVTVRPPGPSSGRAS